MPFRGNYGQAHICAVLGKGHATGARRIYYRCLSAHSYHGRSVYFKVIVRGVFMWLSSPSKHWTGGVMVRLFVCPMKSGEYTCTWTISFTF